MIIQINYDLNNPGQNYEPLINKIKSLGNWARPCKSCFLVSTNYSRNAVGSFLRQFIDSNDRLLVNGFDPDSFYGLLAPEVITWIEQESKSQAHLNW